MDALGNPVRFILTGGQVHDILQAEDLISGISFEHLLADRGYDANWLRAQVALALGRDRNIAHTRELIVTACYAHLLALEGRRWTKVIREAGIQQQ